MNAIEKGLTFYECISRALSTPDAPLTGIDVHQELLLLWANLFFQGALRYKTLDSLIQDIEQNITSHLVIKPSVSLNRAAEQWIARLYSNMPYMPKHIAQWVEKYPKVLKKEALQFVYYHRKRHRLFCQRVFALLAAQRFDCTVVIVKGDSIRRFCPLEGDEYLTLLSTKTIAITQEEGGSSSSKKGERCGSLSFSLLEEPTTTAADFALRLEPFSSFEDSDGGDGGVVIWENAVVLN